MVSVLLLGEEGGSLDLLVSLMPFVGVLLITAAVLMRLRNRKRRQAQEPTAGEQMEQMRQGRAMHGDLEQLMVEIEQLARRMSAQLDAKSVRLERLLREADERIERLSQLESGRGGAADGETGGAERGGGEGESGRGDWWGGQAAESALPGEAPSAGEGEPEAGQAEQQMRRWVYELADQGLSAVEIARRLDEHVGKIELVLALRE